MTNKIQININTVFSDFIDAYFNGQDITEEQLNVPIIQLGLNTGWLKLKVQELEANKENAFIKRTGFNRDFGNTAGTVVEGNDPRLSDARTPKPHSHELAQLTLTSTANGYIFNNSGVLEIRQSTSGAVNWADIIGKPLIFASNIANVDGLATALSGKANTSHTHSITNVTNLRTELDARASILHSHQISEIVGLDAYINSNSGSTPTKIVKQVFTSTGTSSYTITSTGQVFKVTLNGLDLDNGEWSQSSNTVTVTGTSAGDKVIVYCQEGSGTVGRVRFTAAAGTNNFTLPNSNLVWQVTLNGFDLDDYSQSGTTLTVTNLSVGDILLVYSNP